MRSRYGTWVLPKGGVEEREALEEAARREIGEEIGLTRLASRGPLGWTEHEFEREETRYRKRVDWFLFEAQSDAQPRPDVQQGALDCGWFRAEKVLCLLSHDDQRAMVRRALAKMGSAPDSDG